MSTANAFIRSGQARRVLVIGSEVFSSILDWTDRSTGVLFGDGAGAVVLEASDAPGILATELHADGKQEGLLYARGGVAYGGGHCVPSLRMGRPSLNLQSMRCHARPSRYASRLGLI